MVERISNFLGKYSLIPENYRKLGFFCIAAVIIFSLYDVLIDLTLTFLHTSFEWFEFGLEELIEYLFHTTRQQTQTIVFYLLLSVGVLVCYRLGVKLTEIYRRMHKKALVEWEAFKIRFAYFWQRQSRLDKIKLFFSGSAGFVVLAFLAFS